MFALLGSIPSPHSGVVHLGPLVIHMYGVMLLLGIAACVWLTNLRWRAVGGEFDLVVRVTVWGVAFGVIGARIYHDLTSWADVPSPKWKGVFEVWQGGLGIWGGILFGAIAGVIVIRHAGERPLVFLDAAAPGLLLAQGIGRIGNWWNQELFGKPTKLPWGLQIDDYHLPPHTPSYLQGTLFHPTFLYELIWDVLGVFILLWVARRFTLKPPALFALYVSYYCFGRFFEELLRIDPSHHIAGLRLNAWVSIIVFICSTGFFVWWQLLGHGSDPPPNPPRKPKVVKREVPQGPKMTIPRGRVR
jgi:prolipoprotein diacylglyceryl transferase